jgi:hypothetical protein
MPKPWRTTGQNVHQKFYETADKKLPPPLHLALALAVASPAAPVPQRPRASHFHVPRRCRTDRGGPIAGGTKFHPAVGQWGGPPTSGYNMQMRWDLRKYPTVAAPPSIGRCSFKRRMLSRLFSNAGEFIRRRGNVRGPLKIPRSLRILYSHNYLACTRVSWEAQVFGFSPGFVGLNATLMKSHTIIICREPPNLCYHQFSLNFGLHMRSLFLIGDKSCS